MSVLISVNVVVFEVGNVSSRCVMFFLFILDSIFHTYTHTHTHTHTQFVVSFLNYVFRPYKAVIKFVCMYEVAALVHLCVYFLLLSRYLPLLVIKLLKTIFITKGDKQRDNEKCICKCIVATTSCMCTNLMMPYQAETCSSNNKLVQKGNS
jgi:hypothetical protein